MRTEKLVIVGSGCAGLTAGIYAARANLSPLIIEGAQPCGQLTTTSSVENFPGFPEGVNGFDLMQNIYSQARRFGAQFLAEKVEKVDLEKKIIFIGGDTIIQSEAVIIATGASPRKLGIPGEETFYGGKGVSCCATCDGAFYRNKEVVVVGGGDSACEEALFLTRFCSKVYLVHRRDQLRASKIMADRVKSNPKINILWNSVPQKITGEKSVDGIVLQTGSKTWELACSCVFLGIGHIPNTEIFKGQLDLDTEGYILTQGVETKFPGVFVAGDCCDKKYRQAITSAAMGCMAAISAERFLA